MVKNNHIIEAFNVRACAMPVIVIQNSYCSYCSDATPSSYIFRSCTILSTI